MKNLIVTTVLAAVLIYSSANAQSTQKEICKKFQYNLVTAIQSENTGLRKSGIYLAGKYEIDELTGTLIDALNKEKDPSVKILIGLALYRIDNEEGFEAIKNIAAVEKDKEARRMFNAIVNQIEEDKNILTGNSIANN